MISLSQYGAGFGDADAQLNVYIANRPPMAEYADLAAVEPLQSGEIELINRACGNGWRKVFNVYAKLLFVLDAKQFLFKVQAKSWQLFRDQYLLQAQSNTALWFSAPRLNGDSRKIRVESAFRVRAQGPQASKALQPGPYVFHPWDNCRHRAPPQGSLRPACAD